MKIINLSNSICKLTFNLIFNLSKSNDIRFFAIGKDITKTDQQGIETRAKRTQRLLDNDFKPVDVLKELYNLVINPTEKKIDLAIDTTNWKTRGKDTNILMISAIIPKKDIAFPIVYKDLNKAGNPNCEEKVEIVKQCIEIIPPEDINYILCDGAFLGSQFVHFLHDTSINFIIRIRTNMKFVISGEECVTKDLFDDLKLKEHRLFATYYYGICIHLIGLKYRNDKGNEELLIIMTNDRLSTADLILKKYRKRWKIETLFGYYKTRGFNIENSKTTSSKRIENLIFLMSLSMLLIFKMAEKYKNRIYNKKNSESQNYTYSFFRIGIEAIKQYFSDFLYIINSIFELIESFYLEKTLIYKQKLKAVYNYS